MISVCMTTYNGMPFLADQLQSMLCQLPDSAEVICGDDGSTDGTIAYLQALADSRLSILHSSRRLGVVKNMERCLERAAGHLVFLADQDDVWLPGKVETVEKRMRETRALLCVHNAVITDQSLRRLDRDYFEVMRPNTTVLRNLWRNTLIGATMAVSSQLLDYALPFPRGIGMHDIWLGLLAGRLGHIELITDRLMLYRRHTGNLSTTFRTSTRPTATKVEERIRTGLALLNRTR